MSGFAPLLAITNPMVYTRKAVPDMSGHGYAAEATRLEGLILKAGRSLP